MSRVAQHPLSPQHTGSSIPSTFSGKTNSTWVSSMTSYSSPTSVKSPGDALRSKYSKPAMSPDVRRDPRQNKMWSPASSRGHTRASSNASMSSFPAFDAGSGYESVISPPPAAAAKYQEYAEARSPSISSASKVKIKPFLRKIASQDKGSIELSRSVAENEGLGIYTSSNSNAGNKRRDGNRHHGGYHNRTGSAVSQSSAMTSSSRRGAQYVHPMRQTPQSYTPPVMQSSHTSRANSEDGGEGYSAYNYDRTPPPGIVPQAIPYAPLPATSSSTRRTPPPPLFVRTHSSSRLNSTSSQATVPAPPHSGGTTSSYRTPIDPLLHYNQIDAASPETMFPLPTSTTTARSSLDSSFRSHLPGSKRSRSNTKTEADEIDPIARVAALRADFAAKEAAKDEKYAAARSRALEKEQRRQERRDESLRRKAEGTTSGTRSRARSTASSNAGTVTRGGRNGSEKSLPIPPIATVEYSSTYSAGSPSPYAAAVRDEELEYIRRGKRPPASVRTKSGASNVGGGGGGGARAKKTSSSRRDLEKGGVEGGECKASGVRSGWSSFWFGFKTMWLKFKRSMGSKSSG